MNETKIRLPKKRQKRRKIDDVIVDAMNDSASFQFENSEINGANEKTRESSGTTFRGKSNLNHHNINKHQQGDQTSSEPCNKPFERQTNTNHQKVKKILSQMKSVVVPFPQCQLCNITFKSKYFLKIHIQRGHKAGKQKLPVVHESTQCPLCSIVLNHSHLLRL